MGVNGLQSAPPRNGEGDRSAQPNGGGVISASDAAYKRAKRERRSGNLPEVILWRELRKRPGGYKFRRQHPISDCVLDVACLERRLAIEVDGAAHDRGDRPERDVRRDAYLRSRGFEVLRISAREILGNLEGAIMTVVVACDRRSPLHHQPVAGGPPPRSGEVA
jgi:very-short-patch-repair endonuclease